MVSTVPAVHADISDLFFNLDHDDAKVMVDGKFDHYDGTKMLEQATWFVGCIERIAYVYAPSTDQLLMDFYGRL
jgi:hypothetical protein